MNFDPKSPYNNARELHSLWTYGGDPLPWYQRMSEAYGENETILLLEAYLYRMRASDEEVTVVMGTVENFIRDIVSIKAESE